MTHIVRMTREKDECFALLPRFTEAMRNFAYTYEQRGADEMCRRFEANFVLDGNDAAGWIALDDAGTVRGHVLVFIEYVLNAPVAYVQQLRIDSSAISIPQREQVMEELDQWARAQRCTEIMSITRVDYPRLWKRYGFERWRAVYRKTL